MCKSVEIKQMAHILNDFRRSKWVFLAPLIQTRTNVRININSCPSFLPRQGLLCIGTELAPFIKVGEAQEPKLIAGVGLVFEKRSDAISRSSAPSPA